jgi:hypothetical protein
MKTLTHIIAAIALGAGCAADGQGRGEEGTTGNEESSSGEDTFPTTTTPTTTTASSTTTTASTTDPTDPTDTGEDTTTGDGGYDFENGAPEEYAQIDRAGMPLATSLVASKDEYNAATPDDDVDAQFVPEIIDAVTVLHMGLDDDLVALGLTPCDVDTCIAQLTSYIVPDVIRIELAQGSGFPNGRRLEDTGMDIMLAIVLLDLEVHDETTLLDMPLTPTANDEPLGAQFPYLPDPH